MYMYFENVFKFLELIYLFNIYVLIIKVGFLNINEFYK